MYIVFVCRQVGGGGGGGCSTLDSEVMLSYLVLFYMYLMLNGWSVGIIALSNLMCQKLLHIVESWGSGKECVATPELLLLCF